MKTIETKLYSFKELNEPAKARIIASKAENVCDESTRSEIMDSIKAICEACNLSLRDWSIGSYNQSWKLKVSGNSEDLEGPRALTWFYNVIKNNGYEMRPLFGGGKRWYLEFPGTCGFTGVCWDDSVLESIWRSLRAGQCVREAFDNVAYDAGQWLEKEEEYQRSEECILQYLDQHEENYTEDGNEF